MSNLNLDSFESGFVSVLTDECECVELSNALMSSSFSSRRQIMYEIQKHTAHTHTHDFNRAMRSNHHQIHISGIQRIAFAFAFKCPGQTAVN